MTLAAVVTVAASGCGGDDGPSKGEFVKQVDAACKRHNATISAAAGKLLAGGKLPSPREFGKLATQTIIPELSAQVAELRKIEPSKDEATGYEGWIADSEALKNKLTGNPAIIQDATQLKSVNDEADALGLSSACHVGPG